MDDVRRYLQTFEELRRRKHWTTDTTVLRLAALSLAAADVRDPWGELHGAAEVIRRRSSWSGPLRSPVRYAIAAMILRRGLDAGRVHEEVERTVKAMRERRLRRSGLHATLAACLLVLHHDGRAVPGPTIDRMQEVLGRWKQDHPWITGTDDYPMAALHATRDIGVEAGAARVEAIYQALRKRGCGRGNPLQLASHLLSLGEGAPASLAGRFDRIRKALAERSIRCGRSRYDELAILTLTPTSPAALVRRVVADVEALRAERPRPTKDLAFSIASGLALGRELPAAGAVVDVSAIRAAQAALEAQQAAVMAAVAAGSVAATTAATS